VTDTSRRETDLALARLGRVVRELREARGLSVEELSVACKIAEAFDLSGGELASKAQL